MIATSNFLIPNGTFIAEIIAFVIVLAVVARYILPPVNKMLAERQEAIRAELAAADAAKADAAAAAADRREALGHARQQAREIVEQAQRTAERLSEEARSRGQSEYERLVSSAEAEVHLARQRALEEAAQRLGELVVEVVERIIGREMDAAAHRDLIDEAVEALARDTGASDAAAAGGSRAVNPAVQGYTAAVLDEVPGADRATLAADLAAVDRLVDRNPELSVAMTDVAVPPRARRAVLEDVLERRVTPAARRVAGYAVGAVRSQEVPAALAWVANHARQVAEGHGGAEPPLGHLEARRRVGGYAAAVFEEVEVADLEEIEDELFRFARTVGATPALRSALGDRDLPVEERRGIVEDLLAAKVRPATLRLAGYAVTGGRPRDIVGTLDWLAEQTAEARGWRVARVRSGQEIDDAERAKLGDTLSHLAGSPVELQVTVDPALLAGVNVEIGDLQLDATARGRLERLREHVVTGGWQDRGFGRLERAAHGEAAGDGAGADASDGHHPEGR